MYNLLWNHTNVDLNWLKDYWIVKDVKQNSMFGWGDNPFQNCVRKHNAFKKGRLLGTLPLRMKSIKTFHGIAE
jgi:hypothetical protein